MVVHAQCLKPYTTLGTPANSSVVAPFPYIVHAVCLLNCIPLSADCVFENNEEIKSKKYEKEHKFRYDDAIEVKKKGH